MAHVTGKPILAPHRGRPAEIVQPVGDYVDKKSLKPHAFPHGTQPEFPLPHASQVVVLHREAGAALVDLGTEIDGGQPPVPAELAVPDRVAEESVQPRRSQGPRLLLRDVGNVVPIGAAAETRAPAHRVIPEPLDLGAPADPPWRLRDAGMHEPDHDLCAVRLPHAARADVGLVEPDVVADVPVRDAVSYTHLTLP